MTESAYFTDRYYMVKDMAELMGCEIYRVTKAMQLVSFPEPTFRIGSTRLWEKNVAEPYFPQMAAYLESTAKARRKAAIVADIAAYIRARGLAKQHAYDCETDYLRWSSRRQNERTVKHYGGWVSLVQQAMGGNLCPDRLS